MQREDQPVIAERSGGSFVADPEPLPSDVSPHRFRRGLLRLGRLVADGQPWHMCRAPLPEVGCGLVGSGGLCLPSLGPPALLQLAGGPAVDEEGRVAVSCHDAEQAGGFAGNNVVYSKTPVTLSSAGTHIERDFDPETVR